MGQKIAGGCACGAIRYATETDPIVMVNCHCRDCQRTTGGGYAAVMVLPAQAVTLTGEPRYFRTVGDAGKWVDRGFCPVCGSPVTLKLERFPDAIGIQAASLDEPKQFAPAMDLFTASAQPWDHMASETQKKPKGFAS
jgi:hypothetical protein